MNQYYGHVVEIAKFKQGGIEFAEHIGGIRSSCKKIQGRDVPKRKKDS